MKGTWVSFGVILAAVSYYLSTINPNDVAWVGFMAGILILIIGLFTSEKRI